MSYVVRVEKDQSPCLVTSLLDDVIVDIVARVSIIYYPILSIVSKSFRSLVASPELYTRRSLLGCTEHCLYVVLYQYYTRKHHLYILRRKVNNNRLVIIRSFPYMLFYVSYVAAGSKIYVLKHLEGLSDIQDICIDCRSHTVQPISDIPKPMHSMAADIIGGKVYVIWDCYCDDEVSGTGWRKRFMVFDTESQMWEPMMINPDIKINLRPNVVVMEDKIYLQDSANSFVYEPKESKWKLDEMLNCKD